MVGPILGIRLLPCEGGRSFSGYWREKGPPVHTAINYNLKRDRRGFNQGFNGTEFAICGPGNTSNGNETSSEGKYFPRFIIKKVA
jgi:hypothetical protein